MDLLIGPVSWDDLRAALDGHGPGMLQIALRRQDRALAQRARHGKHITAGT